MVVYEVDFNYSTRHVVTRRSYAAIVRVQYKLKLTPQLENLVKNDYAKYLFIRTTKNEITFLSVGVILRCETIYYHNVLSLLINWSHDLTHQI